MKKAVVAKRYTKTYRGQKQQAAVSFGGRTTVFFRTLSSSLNTWKHFKYREPRSSFVPIYR